MRKMAHKEDPLSRLKDLDMKQIGDDNFSRASMSGSSVRTDLDMDPLGFVDRKNRFFNDTVSEIGDEKEKDMLFDHTLKHGVFNDLKRSPLREKMPHQLQMYEPALDRRLFAKDNARQAPAVADQPVMNKDLSMSMSNNMRFKKFEPRAEKADVSNEGLNYADNFQFNPTKFYCKEHTGNEVEFVSEVNNNFYCKKCDPEKIAGCKEAVLSSIPYKL